MYPTVLGIDPGTARMGWAIVEKNASREIAIDYGCLETPANTPLPERLETIYRFIQDLVSKYHPQAASIENLFFANNAKTVMSVDAARGVIILSCQLKKLPIFQYTPLEIKSCLTGYGKADKQQVQFMVKNLLRLDEVPTPDDTADALAVALTHLARERSATIGS